MLIARGRGRAACVGLLAGMLAVFIPAPVIAQAYPAKPVKLIVGFPPGGGSDALARLLAAALNSVEARCTWLRHHRTPLPVPHRAASRTSQA